MKNSISPQRAHSQQWSLECTLELIVIVEYIINYDVARGSLEHSLKATFSGLINFTFSIKRARAPRDDALSRPPARPRARYQPHRGKLSCPSTFITKASECPGRKQLEALALRAHCLIRISKLSRALNSPPRARCARVTASFPLGPTTGPKRGSTNEKRAPPEQSEAHNT